MNLIGQFFLVGSPGWELTVTPLPQNVGCFLPFEAILRAGFLEEMLAISSKKYSFVLVFSFFGYYIFTILPKYHLKGRFSLKSTLNYHNNCI